MTRVLWDSKALGALGGVSVEPLRARTPESELESERVESESEL